MDSEGFIHNGRRVFALRYRLASEPPQVMELIVPLDAHGNAVGPTCAADPAKRIVNVHRGEKIVHDGKEYTVQAVEVFRSSPVD